MKRNEGPKLGCRAKGSKYGCLNFNFMVAISHSKGVVLCCQYGKTSIVDKII